MNNKLNTAKAPYIKHNSPKVKGVVNFADRFWYVLELKIKKLKIAIQKPDNHLDANIKDIKKHWLTWLSNINN